MLNVDGIESSVCQYKINMMTLFEANNRKITVPHVLFIRKSCIGTFLFHGPVLL